MLQNRSVATIDSPEFINVTPYNPLISECEIKVFYLGENRNHSVITKDVAIQMANSLPGTPIVGAWRREISDFGDHGHVMKIEDGEVKFSCKTVPYGFVAPDAQIWFQKFKDVDKDGNEVEREYLMTTGYLWTGQYEEVKKTLQEGQPQSMELDEETLKGSWATDDNSGIDFFIINDALFSKLCILGDSVEPCFEGASVTSPDVSTKFSRDEQFARTLFTMMNELKDALSKNEGGLNMLVEDTMFEAGEQGVGTDMPKDTVNEEVKSGFEMAEAEEVEEEFAKKKDSEEDPSEEDEEYACGGCGKPKAECACGKPNAQCAKEEDKASEEDKKAGEDEPTENACGKKNYSVEEYEALEQELESLKSELAELRAFQLNVVNQQKDELINRYHMLSDEAKREIIEHKEEFSLEDIESKLALLYVANFADFSTVDGKIENKVEEVEESDPITTFSLDTETTEVVPAFVEALRRNRQ